MIERGHRDVRPFGQRRPENRSGAWGSNGEGPGGDVSGIADRDASPKPAGPLAWAVRTAAIAGLMSVFATQYLARVGVPGEVAVTRIAQGGRALPPDPETTGSIGRTAAISARSASVTPSAAAQATRLDPCAVAVAGRPRP